MKIICPACDGEVDKLATGTWGEPTAENLKQKLAPYICSLCATLLLIELPSNRLWIPPAEGIRIMQGNAVLWAELCRIQQAIRSLPNRRTPRTDLTRAASASCPQKTSGRNREKN